MGCVKTIDFDKFPRQSDQNYEYPQLGKRCEVVFHYNTANSLLGTIVRSDLEPPFETIIKLDNGRYIRGVECQYRILN